jgi:hypothetical protein
MAISGVNVMNETQVLLSQLAVDQLSNLKPKVGHDDSDLDKTNRFSTIWLTLAGKRI